MYKCKTFHQKKNPPDFITFVPFNCHFFRTAKNTVINAGLELLVALKYHKIFSSNYTKINHMYIFLTRILKINFILS